MAVPAKPGSRREASVRDQLQAAYRRFLSESEPTPKDAAGRDLIRAVFGSDALAEDPLRRPAQEHGPIRQPD